ncbi:hypothetical protein ACHAXT_006328 [Thalassiosira profunda]
MAIAVERDRSPRSSMLINTILIQTDDGRKFDSSIVYNRIVDDPYSYYRRKRSYLRPVVAGLITIAISAYLMISESIGFSSFPLAVTDRKYLGRKPKVANAGGGLSSSSESGNVKDALNLADDDIDDELRGTEDDDARYGNVRASSASNNIDEQAGTERGESIVPEAQEVQGSDKSNGNSNASESKDEPTAKDEGSSQDGHGEDAEATASRDESEDSAQNEDAGENEEADASQSTSHEDSTDEVEDGDEGAALDGAGTPSVSVSYISQRQEDSPPIETNATHEISAVEDETSSNRNITTAVGEEDASEGYPLQSEGRYDNGDPSKNKYDEAVGDGVLKFLGKEPDGADADDESLEVEEERDAR